MSVGVFGYGLVVAQTPTKKVDFTADVLPVLTAHCSPCHTKADPSADLSLTNFDSVAKTVKAGDPDHSLLLERILGKGGLPRMPMGFKPLSDGDTNIIRTWISQGAAKSSGATAKRHWAFVPPIQQPMLPTVKHGIWVKNAIDAFTLAKMESHGLSPSPKADKVTLIRRLSLDLIGLPPTPAEVDAFVADKSPYAYGTVVDRLLASPHYGERMALPWLEAARYADSNGFQQDGDTFQYVWRDWVVKALNDDMRFDEFTIEQLAGDLLPNPTTDQLVATGFNRNHMLNGEGGAIAEEQRNVNLFDRVDTTSTAWLGLTMGCTRCHDHKYDPLTQRDYYSMMAFFNNVPETGVPAGSGQYRIADPWIYAGTPAQMNELHAVQKKDADAKSALETFRKSPEFEADLVNQITAMRNDLKNAMEAKVSFLPWSEVGTFVGDSFDDAFSRSFGPEAKAVVDHPHPEWMDGNVYELNGDRTAYYLLRRIHSDQAAVYLFSVGSDDAVKAWFNGKEILSHKVTRGALPDSELLRVTLKPGDNTFLLKIINGAGIGGFYFKPYVGGVKDDIAKLLRSDAPADQQLLTKAIATSSNSGKLGALVGGANMAAENLFKLTNEMPRVMVMSDAKPRITYLLNRGNYTEPRDKVVPATPASLPALGTPIKNRLDLAKWMVSPQNPLTARFQVNRAWQLFFGRGLVRTEENFGIKGEPPTHPELLDWLAVHFRDSGWDLKRLHKLIVMSNTYQQSSKVSASVLKEDTANIYLSHAARFRLPSTILRDVALQASGLLVPKIGGKPVYPYQPKDIWDGLSITLERDFSYPQSKGEDLYRRSLYTFWRRTVAPGNMFDASTRQVCTVKPSLTSSPLHALTMMNDPTWVEAGRALATKVMAMPPERRLTEAFRRVCARRPKPEELQILDRSLQRALTIFRANPMAAKEYLSVGESKADVSPELAAYASVCLAILNLDEAMTRE